MRGANFQIIKKGKTGEDKWKVDLADYARWKAIVCLLKQLSVIQGHGSELAPVLSFFQPFQDLSLRPEEPLAKLWQSRARGTVGWRPADWTLASANHCTQVISQYFIHFNLFFKCIDNDLFSFFHKEKKAFCTLSNSFCWDQPTKACWNCTCGTRVLAVGKVWPRAGRVAAHPWMTRPTRPEGTDNGQSLLTLPLCQNVSTFNIVTSTPYMVKHRETIPILWSRELWIGYRWRGVVGGCPQPLTQSFIVFCVSCGPPLIPHSYQMTPFIWANLIITWLILLFSYQKLQ